MKNLLKKIAEKKTNKAFTEWGFNSPKMPKILLAKIEDKKNI